MKKILYILFLFNSSLLPAQNPSDQYEGFKNLLGETWVTKGKWANGTEFHQEIVYEWALSKKIITAKTYDLMDAKQFEDSLRNYGVRAWDEQKKEIMFCDFNVFGEIVIGTVILKGKDIYYSYNYDVKGKIETLTDGWIYKDDNTYDFKVGIYQNGIWEKVFIASVFKRILRN